jgi:hypothetical protein
VYDLYLEIKREKKVAKGKQKRKFIKEKKIKKKTEPPQTRMTIISREKRKVLC